MATDGINYNQPASGTKVAGDTAGGDFYQYCKLASGTVDSVVVIPHTIRYHTGVAALNVAIGPTDPISDIPVVMDFDHHQLHEGEMFSYGAYEADVDDKFDLRIVVPNISGFPVSISTPADYSLAVTKAPHLRWEIVVQAAAMLYFYEAPTFTETPTWATVTPIARERNVTHTPQVTLATSKNAVLNTGTQLWIGMVSVTKSAGGGNDGVNTEFVLKNNTTYMLRVASVDGNNKALIRVQWYEDLGV